MNVRMCLLINVCYKEKDFVNKKKKKEKDLSGRRGYEFSEESGVLISFGII